MDKHAVALVLAEIGTLLELHGENRFKARAFLMAARTVEKLEQDLASLARRGDLEGIPGIGPVTAAVIRELLTTGTSRYYAELRAQTPDGMRELLGVPGLGARKIRQLYEQLGIASLEDLEKAAAEGRIEGVPGFGKRTQEKLALGVGFVRGSTGRRRLSQALEPAQRLVGFLNSLPGVQRVELTGEMRRWLETVSGVDLLAAAKADQVDAVFDAFLTIPGMARLEREGGEATASLADGFAVRLRVVSPARFATSLVLTTGSEAHLAQLREHATRSGHRLDADGLHRSGRGLAPRSEEAFYRQLGLPWIAPELREGQGEVAAAAAGELPVLLDYEDLHGTFHCHTVYSDGRSTITELAEGAHERGWRYLGIADHSQAAGYAGGLSLREIEQQHAEIDRWNDAHGDELRLFKGIEADILADGSLDYADQGDRILGRFDYVVGSIHSGFAQPGPQLTKRVLRALENPHLTILGHLTGRLLLTREAYPIDVETVVAAAAERAVVVEINADPFRMDLDWRYWRTARSLGTLCAIDPDAHSVRALDNVRLGVTMARKGWLTAEDVINAWELERVASFFSRNR